jgi:dTDP-4-amino-4,6-dideoxy-D-galactose acyltransferase
MSVTTKLEPPEMLGWDTEFWGLRVARATSSDGLKEWACANTVGLIGLLVDDPAEVQRSEENGARFMDIRVTLARPTAIQQPPPRVRPFRASDVETLVAIARASHRITRFYADPRLPDDRCDDLYERWIRQSCEGWAAAVLVCEQDAKPAGYITVHIDGDTSSIGLVAVAEQARRRGYGQELVLGAIDYANRHEAVDMTVVTQGRNVAAQRTFQACRFRTTKTQVWMHQWFLP